VELFALYALTLRTNMLIESRRHNQELQAQRKLAETAEASRLSELRTQIEREFADVRATVGEISGQMDRNVQSMKQSLDETANGLAALVGEMDDKIDRALAQNATERNRDERPR
jgi:DNA anti-recombination protein RmuC